MKAIGVDFTYEEMHKQLVKGGVKMDIDIGKTNFFGQQDDQELITGLTQSRLFGSEGSGDQKKIWIEDRLHKLNSKFHEDDKEVAASIIGRAFGLNCVEYHSAKYQVSDKIYRGCYCDSYLAEYEEPVSFAYIFQQTTFDVPMKMPAVKFYIKTLELVTEFTGLAASSIDDYLMNLLVFDFLICNPDRHFSNIELIHNVSTGAYKFTPIFDCGQAFLKRSAMPSRDILESELHKFKTKPFSTNPKKNLIDIERAKEIANQFVSNAGGAESLQALNLEPYFVQLTLHRYHELLSY